MTGKKILIGVTGSIAAYKSAYLVRLLVKAGAEVRVVMTESAADFITPLTLSTLSKNPVFRNVASEESWNNHVELGLWADAMIIAPATANTLAKLANGICDSMVCACYLSAKCPVFIAPAMDLDMWAHPSTKKNVEKLLSYGNRLIPVGYGELASGLTGEGRMAEPEEIINYLEQHFRKKNQLDKIHALVTAGPTYEPIDPVRFIGNESSGKMGVAIAKSLASRNARVSLVIGPSGIEVQDPLIEVIRVKTAEEMHIAATRLFPSCQVAVLAAAVADYRPKESAREKIKKGAGNMVIELERTPDIAQSLGEMKKTRQFIAGFALETSDEEKNAFEKLKNKNFDFIVLNSLRDEGAGFHFDTNKISILSANNKKKHFELKSKREVAEDIVDELVQYLQARGGNGVH